MTSPVALASEPLDARRCRLVLSRAVDGPGERRFASPEEAADSPLAQAVLQVPGVCEVVVSGNEMTVVQDGSQPWETLEPRVRYAVEAASGPLAEAPAAPAASAASAYTVDDDSLYDIVSEIFDAQINPAVAQHGGKVELIDVQDGTVVVRMLGGCQGCGMATVTLRQGIAASLRRSLPAFRGIQDITDHSAGTNPYFAPGTK